MVSWVKRPHLGSNCGVMRARSASMQGRRSWLASQQQTLHFGSVGTTEISRVSSFTSNIVYTYPGLYLVAQIPYFFKRCAISRLLFNMIIEMRLSVPAGALHEHFKRQSYHFLFISVGDILTIDQRTPPFLIQATDA